MRKDIRKVCKKCHTCQTTKKDKCQIQHIPVKDNSGQQWDTLCIDMIAPYKITQKGVNKNEKNNQT